MKAFATESAPGYAWINFDIDTVCTRQWTIPKFPAELLSIRHLSIEINDVEFYYYKFLST